MATDYTCENFEGINLASDWIRDLESSDSRLYKEAVIEKALMAAKLGSANAQCFLFNCYQAYNPYYVFGVKKVPETNGFVNRPNSWPKFWALCEALRTRSLTGHAARDAIIEVSQLFDSSEWNSLCRRVLIKDLRCGITERTLNKVLGKTEWAIPVFTCQLAQDSNDQPAKMKGKKRLEGKLDGVRVLAVFGKSTVQLFSRNGKNFDNFPDIENALLEIHKQLSYVSWFRYGGWVLDGEVTGESFQSLMKQAQRKRDVETKEMIYNIFDIIPLSDFEQGIWKKAQRERIEMLDSIRGTIESQQCLRVTQGIEVDLDNAEGHDQLRRYAEDAVCDGLEGIMIKNLDAPYECKRSSSWMKWKPVITVDLNIVGVEEGTGRNKGRLGAFICEGVDDGRDIRVNVGSGLTDDNRIDYWANRNIIIGDIVEVAADAVTQNQDGTYSLRFPRFVRFRGFEVGEKI